jgi:hypothetical protein
MNDPWSFGWTQVFTLTGFVITIIIAIGGFRTFGRWKREKIEEKRIDTALEALALVYEAKFIFESIWSPGSYSYEYESMPAFPGDNEDRRAERGPFYAALKRIEAHKDFFERAWKVQTRCTALFGTGIEETFLLMHRARREIEVSAEMLMRDPRPQLNSQDNQNTWNSFRADVWPAYGKLSPDGDKVGGKLELFRKDMEALCRPIIDREFGRPERPPDRRCCSGDRSGSNPFGKARKSGICCP